MRKIIALVMCACLVFSLTACSQSQTKSTITGEPAIDSEPYPDSKTYFGTVTGIQKDEEGNVTDISLTSEANGDYVMNVTENTVWVDAAEKIQASPDALAEGQTVYVYHSLVSTRSEPPQSEAFAIILNIPQGIRAGAYHLVEDVTINEDGTRILTNNGGLYLTISEDTSIKEYATGETVDIDTITEGNHVIAWYGNMLTVYPTLAPTSDILVLPN